MNKLSTEKRVQILHMMVEGSSMRSIARVVGVSINTVVKLLEDAGTVCGIYFDNHIKNVKASQIQCDEIWAFCYAKEKNVPRIKGNPEHAGNVWLWTAVDPETKLIISWTISETRDEEEAFYFLHDVRKRLAKGVRPQVSTDGNAPYVSVVPTVFAAKVDFAQVIKHYEKNRYAGSTKKVVSGNPDMAKVSTSIMERHNLTTRMSLRRFTRKTNAHSKKWENHYHSLALYFTWYNFCRIHSTIEQTPAMKAGLSREPDSLEWILDLIDSQELAKKLKAKYGF